MLRIRLGELSDADRTRLHAEIETTLLAELSVPPFFDARTGRERMRPLSDVDRIRARDFVASLPWNHYEAVEISSSSLADQVQEWLARYLDQASPVVGHKLAPVRMLLPQFAARVQRRLVAYVHDGVDDGFGASPAPQSWSASSNAAPLSSPWEAIASGTAALATALAALREEPPPLALRPITPSVADTATERLPVVEHDAPPEPAHLPTAPLPRPIESAPDDSRGDRAIFTQLQQQLVAAMMAAAHVYGVTAPRDDPAGLLAALVHHNAIDDADLRLAEGLLAVCARVIAAGRATTEDLRQALTLYLLFHRGRLGKG